MIVVECEQGSKAWLQARVGVVTASEFDNILTPKTLKPASGKAYLARLVAETMLGRPLDEVTSAWMDRGKEMEDDARRGYAFRHDLDPVRVGFLTRDDGRVGYSPDSLIGDDGLLEIKVLAAQNHAAAMLDPEGTAIEYRGQCQGGLYVAERKWIDLVFHNPVMGDVEIRLTRDEAYMEALLVTDGGALPKFLAKLDAAIAKLRAVKEDRSMTNPFL